MFKLRPVIRRGTVTLVTAGLVIAGGLAAHARVATQGNDTAFHNQPGDSAWVCDEERDGHAVWARYNTLRDHTKPHPRFTIDYSDPDADKCGFLFLSSTRLYNLRVVEDKPNSSNNYLGPWHGYPVVNN